MPSETTLIECFHLLKPLKFKLFKQKKIEMIPYLYINIIVVTKYVV